MYVNVAKTLLSIHSHQQRVRMAQCFLNSGSLELEDALKII